LRILSVLSALLEKVHFRFASMSAYLSAYYRTWRYPRTSALTTGDRPAEKREQAALSYVALFFLSASLDFLGGLFKTEILDRSFSFHRSERRSSKR